MRGTTIIGINYRGNLFKDSYCFLTTSLDQLSQDFKVIHGKMTKLELYNKPIISKELCFYKPELTFNQFMDLQNTNPEFWKLYNEYCLYDCISLFEIWDKFKECVDSLIGKISPFLLRSCPLMSSNTIGSHAKKIIVALNKFNGKLQFPKLMLERFIGIKYNSKGERISVDNEKYKFVSQFKTGGISHCNLPGKHHSGITGVDIKSQYPAALNYAHIPTGESTWVKQYVKQNTVSIG